MAYDSIPLRSLGQLIKTVNLSKKILKKIDKPALVVQVENDPVVSQESAEYILSRINSKIKESYTVPLSYHVFILDKYAHLANKRVLKFIEDN